TPCRTTSVDSATACRSTPCTPASDGDRRSRTPAGSSRARTPSPSHGRGRPSTRAPSACSRAWPRYRSWSARVGRGRRRASAVVTTPVLGQEGLEGRPDVLLALDQHGLEVLGVEAPEDVEHRALVVAGAERFDLAVAEQVRDLGEVLRGAQRG